jgi:streptogramin lyase
VAGGVTRSGAPDGLPPVRDIDTLGAQKLSASPFADWIAVSNDRVWVFGVDQGLVCYDAVSQRRLFGNRFKFALVAMDVGFGSVWLGSSDDHGAILGRVNARTGRVTARIQLPTPKLAKESSVGAGEGGVWALSDAEPRQLIAVDPRSHEVRDVVPAPVGAVAVRAGLGGVWVTTHQPGTLVRLDPRSGREVATIPVGNGARFLALSGQAIWVMNQTDGSVSRVDPESNRVVATTTVTSTRILGGDIAATDAAVWIRVNDVLAVRIDPATNEVTDRLGPAARSGGVGIAEGAVWVSAHDVYAIWRIPIR